MTLTVTRAGALSTCQDLGRIGHAHLGVPRAGALDQPAAALANRLVGNPREAAVIETTLDGVALHTSADHWFAVTGAPCPVTVAGRAVAHGEPVFAPAGSEVVVGAALRGVRSYLAVAGGVAVAPVLGSRSTDTLAWVGPPRLVVGMELAVGTPSGEIRPLDVPPPVRGRALRVIAGPRLDWFAPEAWRTLCTATWRAGAESNRIGLRLGGPALERSRTGELASEPMVLGAVQVPPSGQPVVFLADHPVTGGYPVIAVVLADDLHHCAQARPGDEVTFTPAPRG
ncbi:biotin-dependent carboxyltransferase family protein [Nocardioides sp. AE5]|uniref:5-oxoprolinase subunit C family protein n=1 Tax=Nocardioides sp. AE5 TaxID=2962573 RepID=UPI002881E84E|nr:biotin-dependent carboxyltransferase family protein [Nocardioides sp. AE5]MDT0201333.1 biotin-dependent carboxyltransferase family protein [Nocardioides sp. AE5]